jgi:hypothetical protein
MVTKFLDRILGPGYKALGPLLKTGLEGVIVARSTIAWLREAPLGDLNCGVLLLSKSESGISGVIEFEGDDYIFSDASEEHATAAIISSLGLSLDKSVVKDLDLAKLGATLDLLVKSVNKEKGVEKPGVGAYAKPLKPKLPEPILDQPPQIKTKGKVSSIPSIKPLQQKPDPRAMLPPTLPITPGVPKIKLSEKEMGKKCGVCGKAQTDGVKFTGCSCLKGLAKSVRSLKVKDGVLLSFGPEWEIEAIETLLEAVGRIS